MVGGVVIGLARKEDSTLVHVQDKKDTCSIRVKEYSEYHKQKIRIEVGDKIWWQGGYARWTPEKNSHGVDDGVNCGTYYDIKIPKLGYSH